MWTPVDKKKSSEILSASALSDLGHTVLPVCNISVNVRTTATQKHHLCAENVFFTVLNDSTIVCI